ncbi:hypothetical protein ZWY2020_000661 [Hordeum vulgare]|nr:hypothetical protein ZWY2020_000661 [Hordeum vulgare]
MHTAALLAQSCKVESSCIVGLGKAVSKPALEASNQRWYKFILTETIRSLNRHNDCCVSTSSSSDRTLGRGIYFDKISLEGRSKFDEETLYNLNGIKRKKEYSKKPDGFNNEYIVFSQIKRPADLETVLKTLSSIPATEIQGVKSKPRV